MSRVMFLSTDGLTDQLGQSQIIPYIKKLASKGHRITVISLEKPERNIEINSLKKELVESGIDWRPLKYNKKPPIIATLWDLLSIYRLAYKILRTNTVDIVHCRSYLAALVGFRLKQQSGVKLLFDARGFWIDERIEGKIWNPKNPIYAIIIRWLRKKEKLLYKKADGVVMLTEISKEYLRGSDALNPKTSLLEVIPCCTDETLFLPLEMNNPQRQALSVQLGIHAEDMIVVYHGSLGTWYMMDELVDFFIVLLKKFTTARLLVVTRDLTASFKSKWISTGLPDNKLIVFGAKRNQMPAVLSLASLAIFFIKPSFSKMASSPTKLGELCYMQIPFVTNSGVGDVDELIKQTDKGILVREFSQLGYSEAIDRLGSALISKSSNTTLLHYFSLERGAEKYHSLYLSMTER